MFAKRLYRPHLFLSKPLDEKVNYEDQCEYESMSFEDSTNLPDIWTEKNAKDSSSHSSDLLYEKSGELFKDLAKLYNS